MGILVLATRWTFSNHTLQLLLLLLLVLCARFYCPKKTPSPGTKPYNLTAASLFVSLPCVIPRGTQPCIRAVIRHRKSSIKPHFNQPASGGVTVEGKIIEPGTTVPKGGKTGESQEEVLFVAKKSILAGRALEGGSDAKTHAHHLSHRFDNFHTQKRLEQLQVMICSCLRVQLLHPMALFFSVVLAPLSHPVPIGAVTRCYNFYCMITYLLYGQSFPPLCCCTPSLSLLHFHSLSLNFQRHVLLCARGCLKRANELKVDLT